MAEYENTLSNVKGGITKHNAIDQQRLEEVGTICNTEEIRVIRLSVAI